MVVGPGDVGRWAAHQHVCVHRGHACHGAAGGRLGAETRRTGLPAGRGARAGVVFVPARCGGAVAVGPGAPGTTTACVGQPMNAWIAVAIATPLALLLACL